MGHRASADPRGAPHSSHRAGTAPTTSPHPGHSSPPAGTLAPHAGHGPPSGLTEGSESSTTASVPSRPCSAAPAADSSAFRTSSRKPLEDPDARNGTPAAARQSAACFNDAESRQSNTGWESSVGTGTSGAAVSSRAAELPPAPSSSS